VTGWAAAGVYGLLSAAGLIVGALAGLWLQMRHRTIAAVTAVGVGLLIAAASLYLIAAALEAVSAMVAASGALAGAASFSLANLFLQRWEAGKRKRCGECVRQPSEDAIRGSGLAIAAGSMLDAVPEALIIGAAAAGGSGVLPPVALIGAFALANFAEGLSSAAGMRDAGRSKRYVLLLWTGATLVSAAAAILGFALLSEGGAVERGWLEAFAAGALIALVVETMAPEAVHGEPGFTGLLAMLGFSGLLLALAE
jgi:ZIP family zinc transporter